jgi:hypothetical protein
MFDPTLFGYYILDAKTQFLHFLMIGSVKDLKVSGK